MESRAKLFGHAIHPILIVFPLGLLGTSVVFDVIHIFNGSPTMATVAYWMLIAGLIGGVLAAPFGLIDWLAIPQGTRAKSIGLYHAIANSAALVLFAISLWQRYSTPERPATLAAGLSIVGLCFALFGGWLGGELVERLGVGVDDGANLDAPSSMASTSTRAAGSRN